MGRKKDKSRDHRRRMKLNDRNDDMPDCPDIDTTVTGEESAMPKFHKLNNFDEDSQWSGTFPSDPTWRRTYRGASSTITRETPPALFRRPIASSFLVNRERIVWVVLCVALAILFFSHRSEKNFQLECKFR